MVWKAGQTKMLTSSAGTERGGNRAFTLVELIIVLIIMSVAMGIVAPFMANSFDKYRLKETSRALSSFFRKSREIALKEGIRSLIYFSSDENSFQVVFRKHGERIPLDYPDRFKVTEGVEVEVEVNDPFSGLMEDIPHFVFFPMGNAVGGTVKLFLKDGQRSVVKIDDITGDIAILRESDQS